MKAEGKILVERSAHTMAPGLSLIGRQCFARPDLEPAASDKHATEGTAVLPDVIATFSLAAGRKCQFSSRNRLKKPVNMGSVDLRGAGGRIVSGELRILGEE